MEFLTAMIMNKLLLCAMTSINLINNVKWKKPDTKRYMLLSFHVYKVENQAKLTYCITGQDSVTLGKGRDRLWAERGLWRASGVAMMATSLSGWRLYRCVHCVKIHWTAHLWCVCFPYLCIDKKCLLKCIKVEWGRGSRCRNKHNIPLKMHFSTWALSERFLILIFCSKY